MRGFFTVGAIVAAATVGDGVFALPFIFYSVGWLLSLVYLAVLGVMVATAHAVYLATLEKVGEKERLLGLARVYLGWKGFWAGFLAIVFGLLLTLVAYLVLGTHFIRLAWPGANFPIALFLFWFFISIPVFWNDHSVVELELVGISCTAAIIFVIFFSAWPNITFAGVPAMNLQNLFLPFGAMLFSLAGWTSIEPAYETRRRMGHAGRRRIPWKALTAGTFFAVALYTMFSAGIIGSAPTITPETVAGLGSWPLWKRELLAILGLVAVATVYLPISREIRNSLERDLRWNKFLARGVILFVPLLLVLAGLNNFLAIIGVVGGVFVAFQYLLIVSVGRHALTLDSSRKFFLDLVAVIFAAAAVYEVWIFVVH